MASPDVVGYFGLDLITLDEQTLTDTALAGASERFPDWDPREGNTEVVLIEQLAALIAELNYLGAAIPNSTAEALLRLLGYDRSNGTPPTADVVITVTDDTGHVIPAGTAFRVELGDSVDPVDLVLDADATIPEGDTESQAVSATAAEATTRANGVPAGTTLELLDAIAYIEAVTVTGGPVAGGTDAEDGTAFLTRVGPVLQGLTTTIVRPADVAAYVLAGFPAVVRINVRDAGNASYIDPGQVYVYVLGTGGVATVPTPTKTAIANGLRLRMHGGLSVTILNGTVDALEVQTTVTRLPNYTAAQVQANVATAVEAYIDPRTFPWGNLVRINEVIAVVDAAPGVDTVDALTFQIQGEDPQTTDLALFPAEPEDFEGLAQVTAVTVTVADPS